jgi:hypothetical protein
VLVQHWRFYLFLFQSGTNRVLSLLIFCRPQEVLLSFVVHLLSRFLTISFIKDSVSLDAVLKETVNCPPFILQIEDSFHVIVDNQVSVTSDSVSDALLNVFCSYYVFYIYNSKGNFKDIVVLAK